MENNTQQKADWKTPPTTTTSAQSKQVNEQRSAVQCARNFDYFVFLSTPIWTNGIYVRSAGRAASDHASWSRATENFKNVKTSQMKNM